MAPSRQTAGTELRDHFVHMLPLPTHTAELGSGNPPQGAPQDRESGAASVRHLKKLLKACVLHWYKEVI